MIRSVLIVDDERDIVELLGHVLGERGFRVSTAHDGRAALDHVRAERLDLILLDVMLPELSGRTEGLADSMDSLLWLRTNRPAGPS